MGRLKKKDRTNQRDWHSIRMSTHHWHLLKMISAFDSMDMTLKLDQILELYFIEHHEDLFKAFKSYERK
jgi:hypothetical protein